MDIEDAVNYLGRYFNDMDFSSYNLDEPFPELGDFARNGWESATDRLKKLAMEEHLTLRELALKTTTPKPAFFGTPTQVADTMQEWFQTGACDGYMLNAAVLPDGFNDFVNLVLPELKERGLFREAYQANTLRGNLGLPIPSNRYSKELE